ncbi:MAG: hypothetical protein U1D68_11095 [Arthrobacter sp.]|nr:hypothetical protein [Arthrobacter sp.]MDZ4354018.1 hypothetical protein [Arthrobacter sp.]
MGGQRRTVKIPARIAAPQAEQQEKRPNLWTRTPVVVKILSFAGTATLMAGGFNTWADVADRAVPVVVSFLPKDLAQAGPPTSPVLPTPPVGGYLGGWGPVRETYTMQRPADHLVINSITDQNAHGDERNFVQIKRATEPVTRYVEAVEARPGDRITVYAFVQNDMASNLPNSTVHGLTARLGRGQLPDGRLSVGIVYDGTNIESVWDGATVKVPEKGKLQFINGSLRFVTNHSPKGGFVLPDGGFGVGEPVLVGQTALNGELPVIMIDGKGAGIGYLLFDLLVTDAPAGK